MARAFSMMVKRVIICYNVFVINLNKVMIGIYKITNKTNNKMYIGKSKNIKRRWYQHKYKLSRGISSCIYLQNAWNKYGEENFEFGIIAEGNFNSSELKNLEEIFIKLYGNYNILKISYNNPYSKKRKEETSKNSKKLWKTPGYREKKVKQLREKWADPEYKKKMKEALKSKDWELYPQVVEFWRNKSNGRGGNSHPGKTKIMKEFNLTRAKTQLMLKEIQKDKSIKIIEGYNKEEIYKYWSDSSNANQAKYKHPGRRDIAKTFNISEHKAEQLIKSFM